MPSSPAVVIPVAFCEGLSVATASQVPPGSGGVRRARRELGGGGRNARRDGGASGGFLARGPGWAPQIFTPPAPRSAAETTSTRTVSSTCSKASVFSRQACSQSGVSSSPSPLQGQAKSPKAPPRPLPSPNNHHLQPLSKLQFQSSGLQSVRQSGEQQPREYFSLPGRRS